MPDWYKERFEDDNNYVPETEKEETKKDFGFLDILKGFKAMNVQIVPKCEDFDKVMTKKKFKNHFDIAVIGLLQS